MANDMAKLQNEYAAVKCTIVDLDSIRREMLRKIEKLEQDLQSLNYARRNYEYEIDSFYSKTKKALCELPDNTKFADEYYDRISSVLRGSEARAAEIALEKGKMEALKEIMRLEAEIGAVSHRLDAMYRELTDLHRQMND